MSALVGHRPHAEEDLAEILPKVAADTVTVSDSFRLLFAMRTLGLDAVECPDGRTLDRAGVRLLNAQAGIRESYGLSGTNLAGRIACRIRTSHGPRLAVVLGPPRGPGSANGYGVTDEGLVEIHVEREAGVFEHLATADTRCLRELLVALGQQKRGDL